MTICVSLGKMSARADISSLKEFSTSETDLIINKYYVEQPEKKTLFLPAIAVMRIVQSSTSSGFFELNFQMTLSRIPYQEIVKSSYALLGVLIDGL